MIADRLRQKLADTRPIGKALEICVNQDFDAELRVYDTRAHVITGKPFILPTLQQRPIRSSEELIHYALLNMSPHVTPH